MFIFITNRPLCASIQKTFCFHRTEQHCVFCLTGFRFGDFAFHSKGTCQFGKCFWANTVWGHVASHLPHSCDTEWECHTRIQSWNDRRICKLRPEHVPHPLRILGVKTRWPPLSRVESQSGTCQVLSPYLDPVVVHESSALVCCCENSWLCCCRGRTFLHHLVTMGELCGVCSWAEDTKYSF